MINKMNMCPCDASDSDGQNCHCNCPCWCHGKLGIPCPQHPEKAGYQLEEV